jgi:hypothetical protein
MPTPPAPRSHSGFSGAIGLARADITPPVGVYARNWGAAAHDVADAIHLPLKLSVLTLDSQNGDDPLVLIDADLGWWRPLSVFQRFQQRLLQELSLDSRQVIFALSHSHATAPLMDPDPSLEGSDLLQDWLNRLFDTVISTVKATLNSTFRGTLEWHTGSCHLAAVRDLPDPEGDRYLCGYNPDKTADSTLVLGRISDDSGTLRAVLVNYACHPTTMAWENTSISPDYPGAMRQTIEATGDVIAFFLLGACGDLAPRHQYVGNTAVAEQHGRQLGYAALATLNDMNPPGTELAFEGAVESGAPLAVWRPHPHSYTNELKAIEHSQELELKDWPSAEELEQQRVACEDRALAERLRRKRDIRRILGDGSSFTITIAAWKIGDTLLVGSCCEAYSVLQQELRRRFPDRTVICMNLINGTIGYLPPAEMYEFDVYPAWQTPFAKGSLERVIDGMTAALNQLIQSP